MTAWLRQARTAVLAAVIGAAGLALGAGCTSDTLGSDSDDDRVRSRERSGDPEDPPPGVPRTARLVKRDFGELSFRAPDDGTMWVVESTNNSVIYQKSVRRGDQFRLDPERNRGTLNGDRVIDRDVKPDIRHRIFFESEYSRSRSGDTDWDLASDRERARERARDSELDRDLDRVGDDRISRDPYRY